MNKAIYFATFAIGAIIGSVASWKYCNKKYEQIIQEEIQSVKDAFKQASTIQVNELKEEVTDDHTVESSTVSPTNIDNVDANTAYIKYVKEYFPEEKEVDTIYLISPDEFGEDENYRIVGLSYFTDGVLADDSGQIMDVDKTVGKDALNHFGEYEDDAVHIRNEILKTDYEILLEARKYSEVYPRYND